MGQYQKQNTNQQNQKKSSQEIARSNGSSNALIPVDNRHESIRFNQLQKAADTFIKKNRPLPIQLKIKGDMNKAQELLKGIVKVPSIEPTEDDKKKAKEHIETTMQSALASKRIAGDQKHGSGIPDFQQRVQRDAEQNKKRASAAAEGKPQSESDKQALFGHERFTLSEKQRHIDNKAEAIARDRANILQKQNFDLQQKATQLKKKQ
jgi:hypothetical protein